MTRALASAKGGNGFVGGVNRLGLCGERWMPLTALALYTFGMCPMPGLPVWPPIASAVVLEDMTLARMPRSLSEPKVMGPGHV